MDTEVGYINGMNLGIGFNTATNDLHPTPALDNVSVYRDIPSAGGQEVFFRVEIASSMESISEKMNVSAKASLKYGITAKGSARTSFSSSFKENSFTNYVIVQVNVTNNQTLLDLSKIQFKPEAANLYASDPKSFIQQYGDSFVYGLITGGEFIGVLEVESASASELRDVKAALSGKASYGLYSGNAKVSFEESISKITSSYQMKATIYRQGSGGVLASITPEQLVKEALDFPAKISERGFPRSVLIIPYNHIPHIENVPLDVSQQAAHLDRLGGLHKRFIKYQNDLMFAMDHQKHFVGIDVDQIEDHYNKINDQLNIINKSAESCFKDSSACTTIPNIDLSLLKNILPPQIEGFLDLGKSWLEREGDWVGQWTRRGLTNDFDAKFSMPGEEGTSFLTIIRDKNNNVTVIRRDGGEGAEPSCIYTGTIAEDGKTVKGTYKCHWVNEPMEWSATINF